MEKKREEVTTLTWGLIRMGNTPTKIIGVLTRGTKEGTEDVGTRDISSVS